MVRGNAQADEVFLDGIGAALAESQVVFGRAAFVAMAFNGHAGVGITLEEVRRFLEGFASIRAYRGGVVIEVRVTNFLEEEFVEAEFGSFRDRSRRVDAMCTVESALPPARTGGERVGGGGEG